MTTNTKTLPSGLMIQDLSKRALQVKIADACERYHRKFGCWPTMVWLHPETLGSYISPNGLKLETSQYVQLNCFLAGPLP